MIEITVTVAVLVYLYFKTPKWLSKAGKAAGQAIRN